jgi:hypothetical protein
VVRFFGQGSLDYCAGDEMNCRITGDGRIELISRLK